MSEPKVASILQTKELLAQLRSVDVKGMLECAVDMPGHILAGMSASVNFNEGDIPLDRSSAHVVGLGGSAIAGELLRDMISPKRNITVHRGTLPQRDKRGVVVSSYSGNTREILELSPQVTGGLKSVVFLTSGGELEELGYKWSIPVWKMPTGFQPRAAVGWSLALLSSIYEKWRVLSAVQIRLEKAARRLENSLNQNALENHVIIRAAVPIAEALLNRNGIIMHTITCQGSARRFAAQIAENGKQLCFPMVIPEAMHNAVEGIAGGDPEKWTIIIMSDPSDPPSLRNSNTHVIEYFRKRGFTCVSFPAAGEDKFELTLSRILLADFVSLFLAALRKIDPTNIPTILELKDILNANNQEKPWRDNG